VPSTLRWPLARAIAAASLEWPGSCIRCPLFKIHLHAPQHLGLVLVLVVLLVIEGVASYITGFISSWLGWWLLGWLHATLMEASHWHLSLCVRSSVCSIGCWNIVSEAWGILSVPELYCSWTFAFTARFFTLVCHLSRSLFWWSHCCLACFSTH